MDLSAMDVTTLPDDMVVEILSRLPFKSFCHFKCVSKAWLAFSHDPNYSEKLPTIPTGLLCQKSDDFAIKLVGLPRNEEKFDDGALSFLPHIHNNEELKLVDCCNGLILCKYTSIQDNYASLIRRKYTGFGDTSAATGRFDMCNRIYHYTVCNPATREWRTLPGIRHDEEYPLSKAILVFNPSLSPHFYVFHFKDHVYDPKEGGLWVFSSDLSTWLMYDAWRNCRIDSVYIYPHLFIDGSLYLFRRVKRISVLNGFEAMSSHIPPNHQAIRLPHDPSFDSSNGLSMSTFGLYTGGCFGQSPGTLHYALPDDDGRAIRIWSFDVTGPYEWSLNYHLSMTDAFGRDDLACYDSTRKEWYPVYDIAALDWEREFVFLFDCRASKLYSYFISTGKLNELHDFEHDERICLRRFFHYVPCYTSFNAM